ncbi:MAG: hypothetical protein GY696_13745 [Gammaproteobacteria bacterium]|nr:hypothetical protein [Gammaproteobacteria bacterium]
MSLDPILSASVSGVMSPPMSVSPQFQEPCLNKESGVSKGERSSDDWQEREVEGNLREEWQAKGGRPK